MSWHEISLRRNSRLVSGGTIASQATPTRADKSRRDVAGQPTSAPYGPFVCGYSTLRTVNLPRDTCSEKGKGAQNKVPNGSQKTVSVGKPQTRTAGTGSRQGKGSQVGAHRRPEPHTSPLVQGPDRIRETRRLQSTVSTTPSGPPEDPQGSHGTGPTEPERTHVCVAPKEGRATSEVELKRSTDSDETSLDTPS